MPLESFEQLVGQVSQVQERALGFSLQVCQFANCWGQNIYVSLVVAAWEEKKPDIRWGTSKVTACTTCTRKIIYTLN